MDRATSWFEDQSLEGGLLYLQATVAGTTAVEEIGYTLDGTDHPVSAATALDERIALPAGKYVVGAYAKVNGKTIRSESKETIVTPVPTLTNAIRSSCTNNGLYRTTNSLEGNRIEVSYTLSDPFFTEVLASVELVCDEGTLLDLLKESVYVSSDLRTCKGCRAVAELQNGYRIEGTPTTRPSPASLATISSTGRTIAVWGRRAGLPAAPNGTPPIWISSTTTPPRPRDSACRNRTRSHMN